MQVARYKKGGLVFSARTTAGTSRTPSGSGPSASPHAKGPAAKLGHTARGRLESWREAVASVSEEAFAAGDCAVLRQRLAEQPDALPLLDPDLPGLHDGDGVEALLAEHHSARIVAFPSRYSDAEGERLVHIGVQGYLSADADAPVISRAVALVRSGSMWLSRPLCWNASSGTTVRRMTCTDTARPDTG
jgi:DNA-binding NarL/FixJ family response regulator